MTINSAGRGIKVLYDSEKEGRSMLSDIHVVGTCFDKIIFMVEWKYLMTQFNKTPFVRIY
jgi:hypothetical protein